MAKATLFGFGTPVMDHFARVDDSFIESHIFSKGSSNFVDRDELDVLVRELGNGLFHSEPGDNARNVCDAFSRLSLFKRQSFSSAYAGTVCNDASGKKIVSSLESSGVESLLHHSEGSSGDIVCLITPDGERTFAVELGSSVNYPIEKMGVFPPSDYIFLSSITALSNGNVSEIASRLLSFSWRKGAKVAVSLESPAMIASNRKKVLEVAAKADIIFINLMELEALGISEDTMGRLAKLVFLKRGSAGSSVFQMGDRMAEIPADGIDNVVDTTGAGDVFAAGVLYGLASGMSITEAAKMGNTLGGLVIGKYGAILPSSLPAYYLG